MRRKRVVGITERLADFFDVPQNSLAHGMDVEVRSDRDVYIDGCHSIAEYTDECVVLRGGIMTVTVHGSGFELCAFADGRIRVRGQVKEVSFEREVKK